MDDLISRQAAIDVTWEEPSYTDPLNVLTEVRDKIKALPCVYPDYKTDHGYMWLCPKCGLVVHSDFVKCPRCGLVRHDTQQEIGITRCMYCKNWISGYITDNDEFVPPKCGKYQQMVGHCHDDFCSFAERRTDNKS